MADRIGGVAYLFVDGTQYPLRGNFTVSPNRRTRTGIAGQDGHLGFTEMPRVGYIEGDVSTVPGLSFDTIANLDDVTVTAELANGNVYVVRNGWVAGDREINTAEGMARVRFEGDVIELAGAAA